MPLTLQIWIVIVTLGLLAIALLTLRMLTRTLSRTAEDVSRLSLSVRDSIAQVDLVTQDARELVASLRECVVPVRRVVDGFEAVGQRTVNLTSTVLEELERPVYTVAALAQGVRSGATHLLKRLMDRYTPSHSSNNGDHDHE